MRSISIVFALVIIVLLCSCRADFDTVASTGILKFSRDTVYLDTVFTNIGSSTYQLKVYNKSKNDINIPVIQFEKGINSKYRMTVDGQQGSENKIFKDITLLAKDSLYIFIETTASSTDANPTDFLYTDKIQFDRGANLQTVELVTLIQDAIFLYPQRFSDGTTETLPIGDEKIEGFYLDENDPINGNELHFTKTKPYVIYGYAAVPSGKTAILDPGTRVHFHANSGLLVGNKASIQINGGASTTAVLEHEVIFEGDRLEPEFATIPGQWGAFWLSNGSTNNSINHLTIRNATIGLLIQNNDGSTVQLKNTQIYNSSSYGILAQTGKIAGENLVINNAGIASLACLYGGDYRFIHSTFNNNWNNSSQLAVLINNYSSGVNSDSKDLVQATFNNCIIYGSYSNELSLNKKTTAAFNYQFNHCLIKQSTSLANDPLYQFEKDPIHYNGIILNKDPKFFKANQNQLNIDNTSPAFAKGNLIYLIPLDVLGISRTLPPDLGAYQSKAFSK